jgi:hypothetical protein
MKQRQSRILLTILLAMCVPLALAQTDEHESGSDHGETEELHKNFVGGFIGGANEGRNFGSVLGLVYERLLGESFGIGVVAEHTYGELDFAVLAVPFLYRPGRWRLFIAPGIEDSDVGTESLLRLGAGYAFEVGRLEVVPEFAVDFVNGEEVFVLGVVIAKGF